MMVFNIIVSIFIVLKVTLYVCALHQGQGCTLPIGGKGRCIRQEMCALLMHRSNIKMNYKTCGDTRSIICCPLSEKIVTPPLKYHQKCLEYAFNLEQSSVFNHVQFLPAFTSFIVGGVQASTKEFPHMAALGYGNEDDIQWQCGGSLISEKFVMTAAHCVSTGETEELTRVRLGELNLQSAGDDEHLQEFGIVHIFRHPEYAPPALYNDIALIQLDRPVQVTDYVRPACLKATYDIPSSNLIATGWGRMQFIGALSDRLQKVSLDYFTNDDCNQAYASVPFRQLPNGIVDETQICAGGINEQKDTCQGDSGGPLQIADLYNSRLYYIIGITSFGKGCGTNNNPGVYTRVSQYIEWIEQIVWASD